jgi:plastocyanin
VQGRCLKSRLGHTWREGPLPVRVGFTNDSRRASLSGYVKSLVVLGALFIAIPAVAGCGSDDKKSNASTTATTSTGQTTTAPSGASGAGAVQTLELSADPNDALKFDKTRLSAKPGKVTIKMDNPSSLPHAVSILGNGVAVDGKTVNKGGVSTASATLQAGRYDFFCPVDGHKQAGMNGRLIVK